MSPPPQGDRAARPMGWQTGPRRPPAAGGVPHASRRPKFRLLEEEEGDGQEARPETEAPELPEVSDEEALAFLRAIDAYKRRTGRPFPAWSEVLAIVKSLGYRKVED